MVFCAFYSLLEKTQLNFRYIILKLKMFKYQRRSDIWSQSGGAYGYFVGVLFYFLGDPRPVKLIILMELWGGHSDSAFARCSSPHLIIAFAWKSSGVSKTRTWAGFLLPRLRYNDAWRCVWRFLEKHKTIWCNGTLQSERVRACQWEIIYSLQHLVKRVLCCPGPGCDKNSVRSWQARIP